MTEEQKKEMFDLMNGTFDKVIPLMLENNVEGLYKLNLGEGILVDLINKFIEQSYQQGLKEGKGILEDKIWEGYKIDGGYNMPKKLIDLLQ